MNNFLKKALGNQRLLVGAHWVLIGAALLGLGASIPWLALGAALLLVPAGFYFLANLFLTGLDFIAEFERTEGVAPMVRKGE